MEPFIRDMHSTACGDVVTGLFAVPSFNGLSATNTTSPPPQLFQGKSKTTVQGNNCLGGPPPHDSGSFWSAQQSSSFMGVQNNSFMGVQNNSFMGVQDNSCMGVQDKLHETSWDLSNKASSVTNSSQTLLTGPGFASTHLHALHGASIPQTMGLLQHQRGGGMHGEDVHVVHDTNMMKCMATESNLGTSSATPTIDHILEQQRPSSCFEMSTHRVPSTFPSLDYNTTPQSSMNLHVYFPDSISPSFLPEATVEPAVSGITQNHANQEGGISLVEKPFGMPDDVGVLERSQQEGIFDLNQVPGVQDAVSIVKARKKYTPKVAKDKRCPKPRTVSKVGSQEKKTNGRRVKKTLNGGHESGLVDVTCEGGTVAGVVPSGVAAVPSSVVANSASLKRSYTKFSSHDGWGGSEENLGGIMEYNACNNSSNVIMVSESSVKRSLLGRAEPDEAEPLMEHQLSVGSLTSVTSSMNNAHDRPVASVGGGGGRGAVISTFLEQHSTAANKLNVLSSSSRLSQEPLARSDEMRRGVRATESYDTNRTIMLQSDDNNNNNNGCGTRSPVIGNTFMSQSLSSGLYTFDKPLHSQGPVRRSLMGQFNSNSEPTSSEGRLYHSEYCAANQFQELPAEEHDNNRMINSIPTNFVNDSNNLFFQPRTDSPSSRCRFVEAPINVLLPSQLQQSHENSITATTTVSHFSSAAAQQWMSSPGENRFTWREQQQHQQLVSRLNAISNNDGGQLESLVSDVKSQETMYKQLDNCTRESGYDVNHSSALVPDSMSRFEWQPCMMMEGRSSFSRMDSLVESLCPPQELLVPPQPVSLQMMDDKQLLSHVRALMTLPGLSLSPMLVFHYVLQHLPEHEKDRFMVLWSRFFQSHPWAFEDVQDQQLVEEECKLHKTESNVVVQQQQISNSSSQGQQLMVLDEMTLGLPLPGHLVETQAVKQRHKKKQHQQQDDQAGLQIVPYKGKEPRGLVPYDGPFLPLRRRKPRPKVVLDTETVRVWKLLMGSGGNQESEMDADKELKWEQERRAMKAQAETFISRMHLVQGDRSFSRWKGSIVDSVVGAFLTQNVNDVLSSSAFMSMQARFPGRSFRGPLKTKAPEEMGDESLENGCSRSMQQTMSDNADIAIAPLSLNLREQRLADGGAQETLVNNNGVVDNKFCGSLHPHHSLNSHEELKQLPVQQQLAGPNWHEPMVMMEEMSEALNAHSQDYQESNPLPALESRAAEEQSSCRDQMHISSLKFANCTQVHLDNTKHQADDNSSSSSSSSIIQQPIPAFSVGSSSIVNGKESGLPTLHNTSTAAAAAAAAPIAITPENSLESSSSAAVCINAQLDLLSLQPIVDQSETNRELVNGGDQVSRGKYNPNGLTGADRARLEESQVSSKKTFDWEALRSQFAVKCETVHEDGSRTEALPTRTCMNEDGVDWEAVHHADVEVVAGVIKERGLNWILAGRIKAFLERIRKEHGGIDLEWLHSLPTDDAKEFLLSVRGLGLKSVECIRLLTLHQLAFPVDTNVGRICVRLGWVPLEPLPEELQLHLLELYPVQATIQKYLWPRLCTLDQQTLYELHYQMITFGKVFCTKSKPNCNACPMKAECKHFASALSSAKQALPAPEKPSTSPTLALPQGTNSMATEAAAAAAAATEGLQSVVQSSNVAGSQGCCEPIIEEPMTPESDDVWDYDIEDYPLAVELEDDRLELYIDDKSNTAGASSLLQQGNDTVQTTAYSHSLPSTSSLFSTTPSGTTGSGLNNNTTLQDLGNSSSPSEPASTLTFTRTDSSKQDLSPKSTIMTIVDVQLGTSETSLQNLPTSSLSSSKVLVPDVTLPPSQELVLLPPEAASIPIPKLKNIGRLRTVHYVYELPDHHPLLEGMDERETDDPCCYLLAIWSPGEIPSSIPNLDDCNHEDNPFATSSFANEADSIKGTLLVPCRTAMQGSFPLNGTYFQVNEVFADHASSLQPIVVSRTLLWNLRRRFVFFGTSVTSIFRGMTTQEIQACFWRGYVCVRGFDRTSRAPKPLVTRLHLQPHKSTHKGGAMEESND